jgi:hypothetical protein
MDYEENVKIDIEKLRDDLREEALGTYFAAGYGGALIESFDINKASPEELIDIAYRYGIDLNEYVL